MYKCVDLMYTVLLFSFVVMSLVAFTESHHPTSIKAQTLLCTCTTYDYTFDCLEQQMNRIFGGTRGASGTAYYGLLKSQFPRRVSLIEPCLYMYIV